MDNTAAPVICKPIEHGAAVVIHSLTKYIGGHGIAVAGSIVDSGNFDWTADPKRQPLFNEPDASYGGVIWGKAVPELTGANVPFAVRARVCLLRDLGSALAPDNAFAIIQGLETVALRIKGGIEAGKKFIESLKMFYHVANIGDARSLAIHPASTTHSQLNEKELAASGVTQSYVRLCIGLEHIDDIIDDLEQALNKSSKGNLKAVS